MNDTMKQAILSLAHVVATAALTVIVAIAVVLLLVALGCSEIFREDHPVIVGLNSGGLEQTTISVLKPLTGQPVAGIGFSIPVNVVKDTLGGEVSEEGSALPTPTPSPFPAIGPTPDLPATKTALDAIDAQRRLEEQATRTAIEAEREAVRYAASLEATRIAGIPTLTPEPTPTSTPVPPTPTPHPSTFCAEWEAAVRAWIGQGNNYRFGDTQHPDVPSLPMISRGIGFVSPTSQSGSCVPRTALLSVTLPHILCLAPTSTA